MLKFYKSLIKLSEFVLNVMFVLQIVFMITVFLTASYWFLSLLGSSALEFVTPLANGITDLIRLFYHEDIEIGGQVIDGSLLLFDILVLITVFLITKAKYYVYRFKDWVEFLIRRHFTKLEVEFNKELQQELESRIMQSNKAAVLVQFETKEMYVDYNRNAVENKADEAFKIFYASIKHLKGCKFAKSGDKMLILFEDFSRIDDLLNFIDMSINRIRANMKKDKIKLFSYIAVDVYNADTDFYAEIYPILNSLLALQCSAEPLCLGNFKLRYDLNSKQMYAFLEKGSYKGMDDSEVFAIVKKD